MYVVGFQTFGRQFAAHCVPYNNNNNRRADNGKQTFRSKYAFAVKTVRDTARSGLRRTEGRYSALDKFPVRAHNVLQLYIIVVPYYYYYYYCDGTR